MKEHINKLKKFIPIVDRVHGHNHPEFHQVKSTFEEIVSKLERGEDVSNEFKRLNSITDGYKIPDDVCESYAEVYDTLKLLADNYSD